MKSRVRVEHTLMQAFMSQAFHLQQFQDLREKERQLKIQTFLKSKAFQLELTLSNKPVKT